MSKFLNTLSTTTSTRNIDVESARLRLVSKDETHEGVSVMPQVWVRPESERELCDIARVCFEHQVPMTPRGAGTGKANAAVPLAQGCVVSFENMAQILDIDEKSGTARVQPGCVLGHFQNEVEKRGLFYPPDPASLESCTLGGTVATNAGGPRAHRYGVTRDFVLGLRLVNAQGEVTRLGKQSWKGVSGYDLCQLCIGSEGTLGFFSELTLKLVPAPSALVTAFVAFDDVAQAAEWITRITQKGVWAHALEFVDGLCLRALEEHHEGALGFAKGAKAAVIIETSGIDEDAAMKTLMKAVDSCEGEQVLLASDESQRRAIWSARRALSWAVKKMRQKKISEDIVVPRREVPRFLAEFEKLGQKHGVLTCAFGHAGDGNIHAQMLFDSDEDRPRIGALTRELFELTLRLNGSLSGEHGIGLAKKAFMPLEHDALSLLIQRRVKAAFDPAGLMNPGKLFDL